MTEAVMETSAAALGFSVIANLGDDRQFTGQCFVDSDDDLAIINAKVDKVMVIIDRQKAKYRIKDLRKEVAEMEAALGRQEDDLARLEETYEANQAVLDKSIRAALEQTQKLVDEAIARGRAQPVGAEKGQVTGLKREIEQLNEQKAKAQAERDVARSNMAVNVGRFRDAIAKKNEEIAECEALIGDGS